MIRRLLTAALLALLALINTQNQGGARSVSLLTRPMERRPLSAFPRGGGRAHLSGTNDACLDHPSARRRAHRRLPAAPLAALGLTAAACGAARRPRLRRRSAASRCARHCARARDDGRRVSLAPVPSRRRPSAASTRR